MVHWPGRTALEAAPFGHPPVGGKEDSAAGTGADRIPSLTEAAIYVGTPTGATPLSSPWYPEGKCEQVPLQSQIDECRVSEVASVAASLNGDQRLAVSQF
jgi:hypothetical protein